MISLSRLMRENTKKEIAMLYLELRDEMEDD